jgi:predicted phosphodiesterase
METSALGSPDAPSPELRFALFSDIHGNLAALSAVDEALQQEKPVDHVVVAGDLLQGGPRPCEVWDLLKARGWTLLLGNEDHSLIDLEAGPSRAPSNFQRAFLNGIAWTRAQLGEEVLRALATLPDRWRITTPAGDLLVVHASPRSFDDRVGGAHNRAAEVAAAYSGTGASAIAFGHYHRSFVRPMPYALLINVASVGLPPDNRPLACYTILTATVDGWIIEQRQVPYDDAEEAIIAAERGMPPWVRDAD